MNSGSMRSTSYAPGSGATARSGSSTNGSSNPETEQAGWRSERKRLSLTAEEMATRMSPSSLSAQARWAWENLAPLLEDGMTQSEVGSFYDRSEDWVSGMMRTLRLELLAMAAGSPHDDDALTEPAQRSP
jgi:hypothetical protein